MALMWAVIAVSAAVLVVMFISDYSILQSYLWTSIGFGIGTLFCQFVYSAILYPEYLSPLRHLPTPKGRSWLKGSADTIFLDVPTDRIRKWTEEIPNNGLIRYYMAGNIERVVVTGPKALNEILVSKVYDFPKSESLRAKLLRFTGNGILLAEGEEHKAQRKGLLPCFAFRHIKELYPTFWSKGVEMADAFEKQIRKSASKNDVVQIRDLATRATLDNIGLAGMGRDFGSIQNPENRFYRMTKRLRPEPNTATKWIVLITSLTIGADKLFKLPMKWNSASKKAAQYIRETARQIVGEKKEKQRQGAKQGKDIASVALSSGIFTGENIVDQMITFLVAGHETLATSVQWAVYALCKYPEMQTRLREEVHSHLPSTIPSSRYGQTPQPATAAEVDSLPYLNAFCNEVLRFYPPVPSTVRKASKDTSIAGSFIPKGTVLLIVPGATNLNNDMWGPDAEDFNPERWIGEGRANSGGARSNYANLTFLQGPRGCIGQSFAKSEFACLVAVMVGRFRMELQDPGKKMEVTKSISASPRDGIMARLTRVEDW